MLLPALAPDRARQLVTRFTGASVLVIGDAMLDKFIVGRVTRISPEAPVPVVAFDHDMHRIGGAANVAHNIAALGGQARLIAVTGLDEGATTLAHACREAGVSPAFVGDASRSTTTKVRIVTERNQQVARIDYETDTDVSAEVENKLVTSIRQYCNEADAILVSDYQKGTITQRVMQAAVEAAKGRKIPLLVDPKVPHIDRYAGATLITPNQHEAETATLMRARNMDEAQDAARAFAERVRCEAVLITLGDRGMWLRAAGEDGYLPASAREVADVTGAGDTVIATLALALASKAKYSEAARLANQAAGVAVSKFGPATVTPAELLLACGIAGDV